MDKGHGLALDAILVVSSYGQGVGHDRELMIMTKDKKAKAAARSRSEQTGESYAEARRRLSQQPALQGDEPFVNDHCANCFQPLPDHIVGLFCDDWCRDAAASVRYFRRTARDKRQDDPDVQEAIKIRLAFLTIGGYGSLGRRLPASTRAEVIERDEGVCKKCGEPANQVDHIDGSSAELDNLQLLCDSCHRIKTTSRFVPAPLEVQALILELFVTRVYPEAPSRLADDEVAWEGAWQRLKKQRRLRKDEEVRLLISELEARGIDTDGLTTKEELLEVRDDAMTEGVEWEVDEREWNENFIDEGPWYLEEYR